MHLVFAPLRRCKSIRASALLGALAISGCAIHPVQQDVTRIRTVDLVDHIRCETRFAIQDEAIALLRDYRTSQALALADRLVLSRGASWHVSAANDLDAK